MSLKCIVCEDISFDDQAYYLIEVINPMGYIRSSFVHLTVWQLPVITLQPAEVEPYIFTSANFTVAAYGTPSEITFQWYEILNTVGTTEAISGATDDIYIVETGHPRFNGRYFVEVSNQAVVDGLGPATQSDQARYYAQANPTISYCSEDVDLEEGEQFLVRCIYVAYGRLTLSW